MERLHINDVIALSEGELPRNRITLQTEIPENPPPVVVDPVLLQQVVVNLVVMRFTRRSSATAQIESAGQKLLNCARGTTY